MATETIGECEICGVVDHHLVEGLCPGCTARVRPLVESGLRVIAAVVADRRFEAPRERDRAGHEL
jgi:hypothetical protein